MIKLPQEPTPLFPDKSWQRAQLVAICVTSLVRQMKPFSTDDDLLEYRSVFGTAITLFLIHHILKKNGHISLLSYRLIKSLVF